MAACIQGRTKDKAVAFCLSTPALCSWVTPAPCSWVTLSWSCCRHCCCRALMSLELSFFGLMVLTEHQRLNRNPPGFQHQFGNAKVQSHGWNTSWILSPSNRWPLLDYPVGIVLANITNPLWKIYLFSGFCSPLLCIMAFIRGSGCR